MPRDARHSIHERRPAPRTARPLSARRVVASAAAALIAFGMMSLVGCGSGSVPGGGGTSGDDAEGGADARPRVVCTVAMVTDVVREVAGERANVVGLLGQGVDPHSYKPTREDVHRLSAADLVFYNGLLLEGRMTDAFARVARSGKPIFAVTDGIPKDYLRAHPEFAGHYDPHVWMDVSAWSDCVEFVTTTLAGRYPEHADEFRRRGDAYRERLKDLDGYVRKAIASIPESQRVLVTAHDAFGYFSRAYGVPVRSVQGISTDSETGVDDVNRLVDFLVERKLPAVFVESSVNPRKLQAVLAGAKQRGHVVAIGGELFSDAMGEAGTYEGTYLGMIDHNATTIARALGGDVPERGWCGRLAAPAGTAVSAPPVGTASASQVSARDD